MYRRKSRRPHYRFQQGGQKRLTLVISVLVIIVSVIVGVSWAWQDGLLPIGARPAGQASARPVVEFLPDATVGQAAASPSPTPAAGTASASASASASPSSTPTAALPSGGSEGMAFLGNSGISDLYVSGFLPDADYYYKVGLNVQSVFDTAMDQGTVPVIEELSGHDYNEIFLLFGQNELGWPAVNVFLDEYAQVIAKAREYNPNATIYVMSILPMSEEASDRNENGENQTKVNEFNEKLETLARENDAIFLDFTSDLKGEDGYLPAGASADGVHLNQTYLGIWADMIKNRASYMESAG